ELELSRRLVELDARCGNVTAVFDCCHSGELGRDDDVVLAARHEDRAPDWVRAALDPAGPAVALDSHPAIVRLCGASPQRTAYAVERRGRHIGRLTEALLETLDAAGEGWAALTWEGIGHHVRERVIAGVGNEGQWVALVGPRQRRLFSTQVAPRPGSVSSLPHQDSARALLRAGWHQGVAAGDRWAIADMEVQADGALRIRAEGVVESIERNRAVLALDRSAELRAGLPAHLIRAADPLPVRVPPGPLARAVEASAWLAVAKTETEAAATVASHDDGVVVSRRAGDLLASTFDAHDAAGLVECLEDWARGRRLLDCLGAHEASEHPLRWTWARVDERGTTPLTGQRPRLRAEDRIRVDLHSDALFDPWFVAIVLCDPAGRLRLLSTRMPEGIELPPQGHEVVGHRLGVARQGLPLRWPASLRDASEGPACLLLLASRRPMSLGHLVRPQALDHDDALALQGLAKGVLRSHRAPELADACAFGRLDFTLARA
ncbi:MAG: hypothetical protein KDK70_36730, partial [Myxococcales bacterium]|nr:hypothetical protein [Myxococcales bacterium]